MISTLFLVLLGSVLSALSSILSGITLPDWWNGDAGGVIWNFWDWVHAKLYGSGAYQFFNLPFVFRTVAWWYGVRVAMIPAQWLLGIARRFLGPMLPSPSFDSGVFSPGPGTATAQADMSDSVAAWDRIGRQGRADRIEAEMIVHRNNGVR